MISASYFLVSKKYSHHKALVWVPCENGDVPSGAVDVGRFGGRGGEFMYIGRMPLSNDDIVVGTVIPQKQSCYAAWGGNDFKSPSYEVLVNTQPETVQLVWLPVADGYLPPDAVKGGYDAYEEQTIFVARARPPGVLGTHAGGIVQGENAVHIAYHGEEHLVEDYRVLCKKVQGES